MEIRMIIIYKSFKDIHRFVLIGYKISFFLSFTPSPMIIHNNNNNKKKSLIGILHLRILVQ